MNLRNVSDYAIGLDLGVGSVGWAVVDSEGELCRFKGKPTWGSRLFSPANHAAVARIPRGQRRRYVRRRWRINLLQSVFAEEMQTVDSEFFVRLNNSFRVPDDRSFHHPLFNETRFSESEYYKKFPTIYHLRYWLMTTDEKADLRLIYLAMHNIVKRRGNFIRETDSTLSARNANTGAAVDEFIYALCQWCESQGLFFETENVSAALRRALEDKSLPRAAVQAQICDLLEITIAPEGEYVDATLNKSAISALKKAIANAIVGYQAEFGKIFFIEEGVTKFAFKDDEKTAEFLDTCPEEGRELFEALQHVYSAFVLCGLLSWPTDASSKGYALTLSLSQIESYEKYKRDLSTLKQLVKTYQPSCYNEFFRGPMFAGSSDYIPSEAHGYTRYNLGPSKKGSGASQTMDYETFKKEVEKLFQETPAVQDAAYVQMMQDFQEEKFLRRLRTSDNGQIPYQLHLEELTAIIENQGKYYPFLLKNQDELESLVRFRIPYYVGPLPQKGIAPSELQKSCFAWAVRYPEKVDEEIRPWNWEEIVDKHRSAQAFIERMTGTCSYIEGEPVLPKCSLLYEEFCVLNELNGSKWTQDGDDMRRFSFDDRIEIIENLFEKGSTISYKQVEDWMKQKGHSNVHVSGGQGESGYVSRLASYSFFTKKIFHVSELSMQQRIIAEELILWSTLFEDRAIFKEEINRKYGDLFSADQVKALCKKRFIGWGRLSKKLLTGIKTTTDNGPRSIMEIMREGDQTNGRIGRAMVFMEILHDENLGFGKLIESENKKYLENIGHIGINDLPGSPAIRRQINQAQRIVQEIASIAGHAPNAIYVEVTREDDIRKKGSRTTSRYKQMKEAVNAFWVDAEHAFLQDAPNTKAELEKYKANLDDNRLMLYFMQNGKSMYSGKPLHIEELSTYQVDHIIPQSYIKDNSLENMVLVLPGENQKKADNLLIDQSIRKKMGMYWKALHDAKLIGDKKYRNLMSESISQDRAKGFIARQIVETAQSIKLLEQLLVEQYPDTRIVPIKATLSAQLAQACGFVKCREMNNYHHAHDAYRAAQFGRYLEYRYPSIAENPIKYTEIMKRFVQQESEEVRRGKNLSEVSFLVRGFMKSGFDKETGEIFRDAWNAEAEIERMSKCLEYSDCFITRMLEETSGSFWDATVYSPRIESKKLSLPLKKDWDPQRYGSYSREQFAYFFAYKAYNPKTKRYCYQYGEVPVKTASRVNSEPELIVDFAKADAKENGLEFVMFVRKRILKNQIVEINGARFYVRGKKEVRNAKEIALGSRQTKTLVELLAGKEVTKEELSRLASMISEKLEICAPKQAQLFTEKEAKAVENLPNDEAASILVQFLQLASAQRNMMDASAIGMGKAIGCLGITFSKEMGNSDFAFIDQSVTGMFEKRQVLEQL